MAPPHNHLHSSPPPPPPPSSISTELHRRRCSTAQMCFFRILHIISVLPTANVTDNNCLTHDDEICASRGFVADLNIQLHPPSEPEPYESISTGYGDNCVLEKNDRRKSEAFVAEESERATEHSEISHVGDQSSGVDYNEVSEHEGEKPRDEGYLGLLIEAAQLILGDDSDREKTPPCRKTEQRPSKSKYVEAETTARGGAKRRQQWWTTAATEAEWYAEFEDTSPVVRSKRGRNQVLPLKYRDSVVEPLVRWSPENAAVASRRRSK